jgi:hypothetical protein
MRRWNREVHYTKLEKKGGGTLFATFHHNIIYHPQFGLFRSSSLQKYSSKTDRSNSAAVQLLGIAPLRIKLYDIRSKLV